MKVIVPSAKLISPELQNIGKIPAIIYPINQNISFDFFKLKYEAIASEIDIICYENVEKVREKLSNYKLKTNVNLLKLERLDDLGHSVYRGLTDEDDDIIIHFADTIIMDHLPFDKADFICTAKEYLSETWTFYNSYNGKFNFINDKKTPSSPFIDKSIKYDFFIGLFKISNGSYFKKCLETVWKNPLKDMDSFYSALMLYSNDYKFHSYELQDWFDIGHSQKYFETRMQVEARTFNHIEIDKDRGILKKTSKDVEKFIGEIKWYLKLPTDIEYVRPRIFSYSLNYNQPYVCMEYYSYRTLHELFLYAELSGEQWESIFKKIKFVLDDFSRYKLKDDKLNVALKSMYLDKTLNRLNKLRDQSEFINLFKEPICINEKFYLSLNEIFKILEKIIPQMLYDVDTFSIIHGDFCFPNIMIDDNLKFIKLIDPRGKFGKYDIYGDPRYEIAKLLHSIEGKYDFIIKNLFSLEILEENHFNLKILESSRPFDLLEIFISVFQDNLKENIKTVRLIEALLFLSMIPMHKESIDHQYAMLCTGVKLLNEVTNIITPPLDTCIIFVVKAFLLLKWQVLYNE